MSGMGLVGILGLGLCVLALAVHGLGVARRLAETARRLSDPEQLAGLLRPETREALRRQGIDPQELRPDTELSAELRALLAQDMRRALLATLRGGGGGPWRRAGSGAAPPGPSRSGPVPPPMPPAPYAQPADSGARLRWLAAALVIGGAILLLAMRP